MLPPHLWPDTAQIGPDRHLYVGGCDVVGLAREYGTPLYLLDEATFQNNCRAYRAALARQYTGASSVHYASKALLNTAVAQLVAAEGLGLDVVSGGELFVALHAGFPAQQIHLHGNAKPRAELEQTLAAGIGKIMVDSLDELDLLAQLTKGRGMSQAIMLRLAPDIAPDTHAHIQTGQAASKFGLPLEALDSAAERIAAAPGLQFAGLHAHIGSQIFNYRSIEQAVGVLLDCAVQLRDRHGLVARSISPGGGLGTAYTADQPPPDIDTYVAAIGRTVAEGCAARGLAPPELVLEPGRSIVARAGVALYQIVATKQLPTPSSVAGGQLPLANEQLTTDHGLAASRYLHIDGGMADNIRPSLYGARYTALLANRADAPADMHVHVAGRYCESSDVLLRDILLPRVGPGDLLAVAVAGAYTLSMASNYNLVPRPALVLVGGERARLIQRRETYADLIARDVSLDS